jgi:hypothetical protein
MSSPSYPHYTPYNTANTNAAAFAPISEGQLICIRIEQRGDAPYGAFAIQQDVWSGPEPAQKQIEMGNPKGNNKGDGKTPPRRGRPPVFCVTVVASLLMNSSYR